MADYGLIGGLGEGLKQGLLMYQKTKQLNRENQIQNLTSGMEEDENGNMKPGAGLLSKMKAQQLTSQDTIDEHDVNSAASKAADSSYRQALKASNPSQSEAIDQMAPMTAAQVKSYGIPLAKPSIAGGFVVQGSKEKAGGQVDAAKIGADAKVGAAKIGADTKEKTAGTSNLFKWSAAYSKDPEVVKANSALASADQMDKLLSENTTSANMMAKIEALRASGLNRITNYELSSFGGDSAAQERANQAIETLKSGSLTEKNIGQIKEAAKVLRESAQKVRDNKQQYYKSLGAGVGLDQSKTDALLNPVSAQTQPPSGLVGKQKQPPDGHQTVTQGGHTYNWNPTTGKYE